MHSSTPSRPDSVRRADIDSISQVRDNGAKRSLSHGRSTPSSVELAGWRSRPIRGWRRVRRGSGGGCGRCGGHPRRGRRAPGFRRKRRHRRRGGGEERRRLTAAPGRRPRYSGSRSLGAELVGGEIAAARLEELQRTVVADKEPRKEPGRGDKGVFRPAPETATGDLAALAVETEDGSFRVFAGRCRISTRQSRANRERPRSRRTGRRSAPCPTDRGSSRAGAPPSGSPPNRRRYSAWISRA